MQNRGMTLIVPHALDFYLSNFVFQVLLIDVDTYVEILSLLSLRIYLPLQKREYIN